VLPTKSLGWVRFRPLDESTQLNTWNELIGESTQTDALILVRPNKELARVGGTIIEAKESQIGFEFDDQKLEMPIEKILGLVWFQAESSRVRASVDVRLRDQSIWKAKRLERVDNELKLESDSVPQVSIPIDQISEIQFGTSNIRWVVELERIEALQQTPSNWKYSVDISKSAFAPGFVSSKAHGKTATESEQDLLFITPGSYVFRMPEGFSKFEARIERPELAEFRTELTIEIWQESTKVLSTVLAHDADFLDVKANLAPEKKVKLSVVSSVQSTLGTEVKWKQPRVLR
jgi:hypothetical protein